MGGWNKGMPAPTRGKGRHAQWLLAHVDYAGNDCLKWPGFIDERVGRGTLGYNGKIWWAHRLMCVFAHGEPPAEKPQAAHNCGNGHLGCVNPRHLEWKTNQENCQDKSLHGRSSGMRGKTHLTEQEIAQLKSLKGEMPQMAIAREFGVSLSCVQYHLHGKERWPSHNR